MPALPPGYGITEDEYQDWVLTHRPAMLPFLAEYTNARTGERSGGMAVPSMVTEVFDAGKRLFSPGGGFENNPTNESARDAQTLLMSIYGGNALSGMARGAGAARTVHAASPDVLPAGPIVERGFRGVDDPTFVIPKGNIGRSSSAFWATSSPEVANGYAGLRRDGSHWVNDASDIPAAEFDYRDFGGQTIAPAQFNFKNPLVVDASGAQWDSIPFQGRETNTDVLARLARMRGHDGLVVRNVIDEIDELDEAAKPATTYAALRRGTVSSPYTGETLFSDTSRPSLLGSAILAQPEEAPLSFMGWGRR